MNLDKKIDNVIDDIGHKLIEPVIDKFKLMMPLYVVFTKNEKVEKSVKNSPFSSAMLIMSGWTVSLYGPLYGIISLAKYLKK